MRSILLLLILKPLYAHVIEGTKNKFIIKELSDRRAQESRRGEHAIKRSNRKVGSITDEQDLSQCPLSIRAITEGMRGIQYEIVVTFNPMWNVNNW